MPLDISAFTPLNEKQWKQKIQMDLDGLDYNRTLIWQSPEGIAVQPFYTKMAIDKTLEVPSLPKAWNQCSRIYMGDMKVVCQLIDKRLKKDIKSFYLVCDQAFDIKDFCIGLSLKGVNLIFETNFLDQYWLKECKKNLTNRGANVYLNQDPLNLLAKRGNWPLPKEKVFKPLFDFLKSDPTSSILGVNALLYTESGANIIQQLAYAMAQTNEALEQLRAYGELPGEIHLIYTLGIGPNYFFEIAKLRALRALNQTLAEIHSLKLTCRIVATPAKRFMTIYDFNNNLLRSTTSMMAGILGGADFLCNLPYDENYKKSHEFSQGLAQNQLFMLEYEALKKINASVCDGAYYIESISYGIAEKVLALFKDIERSGGWLKSIQKGTIQRKIKESHHNAEYELRDKKKIVVGINQFQDPNQLMLDQIELYPFQKTKPRKTIVAPIVERSLTQKIESQRLNDENIP